MYSVKGWWQSKTIWISIFAILFGIMSMLGITVPIGINPETATEAVIVIIGILAAIFRFQATDQVVASPEKIDKFYNKL